MDVTLNYVENLLNHLKHLVMVTLNVADINMLVGMHVILQC